VAVRLGGRTIGYRPSGTEYAAIELADLTRHDGVSHRRRQAVEHSWGINLPDPDLEPLAPETTDDLCGRPAVRSIAPR